MKDFEAQFNTRVEKLLFIFLFILSFLLCMFQFFDHDEFEAIHTAWKMLHGQIIYIDFFQQKPPFFHFSLMPLIKFFGETIRTLFACKIYMFLIFSAIIYLTSAISKSVFGVKTKFLAPAILLSCTFFTDKLTEIRPDTLYIMLSMLAIYCIYRKNKLDKTHLILSAIFSGLSFVILQKAVFYIIPIIAILCFRLYRRKNTIYDLLLYILTMFITIVPFYIYLFKIVTFEEYYFFNVLINYKFQGAFTPWNNLRLLISENIIFIFIALFGFAILKGSKQKEIGFITLILFMSVFSVNVPNKQYFLPAIPFLAMIAANYICKNSLLKKYSAVALLAIAFYPIVFFIKDISNSKHQNIEQIKRIDYVLTQTTPDDKVYDGSIYFNIFRDDVNYFWFSIRPYGVLDTYKSLKNYQYDIYKDIKKKKPKIIYTKYLDIHHPLIEKYYTPVKEFRRLYIRRSTENE